MTLLAHARPDHLQGSVAHVDEAEGRALVAPVERRKGRKGGEWWERSVVGRK